MENTCKKEKCFFWDLFDGRCPMYIELKYEDKHTHAVRYTEDCAPIRIVLMLTEMYPRLEGIERTQDHIRNETVWTQVVAEIMGKNAGINLEAFVEKRQQLQKRLCLKQLGEHHENQKRGVGDTDAKSGDQ